MPGAAARDTGSEGAVHVSVAAGGDTGACGGGAGLGPSGDKDQDVKEQETQGRSCGEKSRSPSLGHGHLEGPGRRFMTEGQVGRVTFDDLGVKSSAQLQPS